MSRSSLLGSAQNSQAAQIPLRSSSIDFNRPNGTSPPPDRDTGGRLSASLSSQMALRGMRRLERRMNMEENHYLVQWARNNPLNPPVDMRLLDYISNYDSNLMCPICRCPFVEPIVLAECDHCFCRDCIRQSWTAFTSSGLTGGCPSCRTPASLGPRSATSKILVNILDELMVKCPKSEKGCTAQVKRGEVQDHVGIYCGYAMVECVGDACELRVRRQDLDKGCLHYGVSCLDCHQTLFKADLESHWKSECPDRLVQCNLCKSDICHQDSEKHTKRTCPAISVPCPGEAFGCTHRDRKAEADLHTKRCTLAKLAPMLMAQKQRMDEQELAQRQMSRKLEVLEIGFAAMQGIMYSKNENPDNASADESRIPLLETHRRPQGDGATASVTPSSPSDFIFSPSRRPASPADNTWSMHLPSADSASRPGPAPPSFRPEDIPEPYSADLYLRDPFPPPSSHGPYASPLHHLLSMHESLQSEMSRVSTALSELEGRHSMQILNETLRTREEIAYLGGQVAGMNRQLHWLTSAQLQRQQGSSAAASSSDVAGAGADVEAAVNAVSTAATALRGAARVVSAGRDGMGMRRGPSEEGRTKL